MKTYTTLFTLCCLCSLVLAQPTQAQLTAKEIIQNAKDRPDGETRYAEVELKLINKRGRSRLRKIKSYAMDLGKDKKSIMFFTYPGDVDGTGFLSWEYDDPKKENDKWLYLPAMRKTRRISSSSSKTDYFMGTDFTYDDLGSRRVDEDEHRKLADETVDGIDCYVIESIPKDKRELYSRKISWIRKDSFLPLKAEYYDKLKQLQRKYTAIKVEKVQGFWTILEHSMENVKTQHKTFIKMNQVAYNVKVDESLFTVVQLEKGL